LAGAADEAAESVFVSALLSDLDSAFDSEGFDEPDDPDFP
jgi:hypothetical protein